MILHVRNMVCNRCILAVNNTFEELGFKNFTVSMGTVEIEENRLSIEIKEKLNEKLIDLGFELIDDRKSKLIEEIKNLIINMIHNEDLSDQVINWSNIISQALHYEYKYISRLFSSVQGITIEQFIILQKIEKVKEMITYDELTLSEIAWRLGYSSVAHLSNQFKKVTGMPPKEFKHIGAKLRTALDKV
jgi:AraC-like DNA-binding protein